MRNNYLMGTTVGLFILVGLLLRPNKMARRQQILRASVMITMIVPEIDREPMVVDEGLPIPPDEYRPMFKPDSYLVSEGLGTLVNSGDETLLITHDHWSLLDRNLGTVRFGGATSETLFEIDLLQFKKLIRYRDGGTMILEAPRGIEDSRQLIPAKLTGEHGRSQELVSGGTVLVTYRQHDDKGGISIVEAAVQRVEERKGKTVVRLQSRNERSIVGGDSGGGVWFEGTLSGNTWNTIMVESLSTGARRQTSFSIAALYPSSNFVQGAALGGMSPS
jgi:hypothetical protein